MKSLLIALATVAISFSVDIGSIHAQGLIWSLPEDGTLVRYKGLYKQHVRRPDSTEGDLNLQWDRYVEIRSVGKENAEFRGVNQPCRWIEIKVETGKTPEAFLDVGPGGTRMYKLLVPEEEVRGSTEEPVKNGRSIFASHIHIAKGYRRIGDEPTQDITTSVFQLYPLVSLLRHYPSFSEGETTEITSNAGNYSAKKYTGEVTMETNVYRSTNVGEIYVSENMPFGVVAWSAKTVVEEKGSTDDRSAFNETSVIEEVDIKVEAIEQNAQSEFLVN